MIGTPLKFMVDHNVGKLAKWLRMLGYDTVMFTGPDDSDMVDLAIEEGCILLTRDSQIARRRVAVNGRLRLIMIKSDKFADQIEQIVKEVPLNKDDFRPFTICLEDNRPLEKRSKEELENRLPPYVYKTHNDFVECPQCHRLYWKGTHWRNMIDKISNLKFQISNL